MKFFAASCFLPLPVHPFRQRLEKALEHGDVQAVCDRLPFFFAENELCIPENGQMMTDSRIRQRKAFGDLPRRHTALLEQRQDLPPGPVGQGAPCILQGRLLRSGQPSFGPAYLDIHLNIEYMISSVKSSIFR